MKIPEWKVPAEAWEIAAFVNIICGVIATSRGDWSWMVFDGAMALFCAVMAARAENET